VTHSECPVAACVWILPAGRRQGVGIASVKLLLADLHWNPHSYVKQLQEGRQLSDNWQGPALETVLGQRRKRAVGVHGPQLDRAFAACRTMASCR
jgi:hypothetical protein